MADGSVKIDILGDDSDIKKKLDDTEEGLDGLGKKQKETQKETEKTTTKFEELANTIDKQSKELSELKGEYTAAIINFGKGSAEAKALEGKMSSLNTELSKNKEMYSKAAKEAGELSTALDENEKSFATAEIAVGSFVGNALSNLASKCIETIGNIAALADETREYREDMAKLDTAFATTGHSQETASKAYEDFYKILGESDRSVEAANHLAELTKNEEEVAKWGTIASGVTAKFGDSLPLEGLTEAANETAKVGQVTGVVADALNWASKDSAVFKDALGGNEKAMAAFNKALKDGENVEDAFTAALGKMSTEQERSSAITNTLNGLYADAAIEYNEMTAGAQEARLANLDLEQAQARLGETMEPLTTAWTQLKADGLQWFIDNWNVVLVGLTGITTALIVLNKATIAETAAKWAENAAWLASPVTWIILGITAIVAAFVLLWNNCEGFRNFFTGMWESIKTALAPVIEWLGQMFSQAWEYIKGVWEQVEPYFKATWESIKLIFSVVGEILGAFFKKAWEAIKVIWDIAQPYFKMVWENIKVVFSVVGAILSGFFKVAWEAIKAVWNVVGAYFKAVWETIKGIFAVVKNVLSGNWKEAWEAIKKICGAWGDYFKAIWDGIKNVFGAVASWFGSVFSAAWNGIKKIWSNVGTFFKETWEKIKSAFKADNMKEVGMNLLKGLWNGIKDTVGWLKDKVKGVVDKIKGWFTGKDGFDEHSPSKWSEQVAEYVNKGLAIGFEETTEIPVRAAEGLVKAIKQKIEEGQKDTIDTVKEYNSDIIDLEKEKNKKLKELEEKYIEDKKKKNADKKGLEKQYTKDIESINEQHAEKVASIQDNIKNTISSKMQEIVTLEEKYKEDTKKVFDDLANSIEDAQANYESQLASRTASIVSALGLWDEATRNKTTGLELKRNLQSQVRMLEDYNEAIAKLEERNVSTAFINSLKEMGVGATGEIEALVKLSDSQLNSYVDLWEKKNELARTAATEELEPLKAETEAKIEELTNTALDKYAELRAKYTEQGSLLMAELKQAMIEAGQGGYEEIIGQIDDYTEAGEDLMSGVIAGIVDKSPEVANAVKSAVRRAIDAAKAAAGIASPSKVMKKEIGYNLADGVSVGWSDKVADLKNKMAADMQGITARIKTAVSLENARMSQGVGVRDTGFSEVAHAVGMQTAGINSLASEYRRGSSTQVTVPLVIDGREFGRAVVDLGNTETIRTGASLSFA